MTLSKNSHAPNWARPVVGLAPMEGVLDETLRDLLTRVGGYDFCVTEFIRVTDRTVPEKVILNYCPELKTQSATSTGTPVFVQFLGGKPDPLAESAAVACSLGAIGIDLNFGCPAKTVNRHDGGATLLKYPERILKIVEAVRKACPAAVPVSAKMRLGYEDSSLSLEVAQSIESGGASWVTVHARTKLEMYRPPAHWELVAPISAQLQIPVIANGDVTSPEAARACRLASGTPHLMVGRGALARPSLGAEIHSIQKTSLGWNEVQRLMVEFYQQSHKAQHARFALCRLKQWCRYLSQFYPEAQILFEKLKILNQMEPELLQASL